MAPKRIHVLSEVRRLELIEWHKDPNKYRPTKVGLHAFDRGGGIKFGTVVAVLGPDKAGKTAVAVKLTLSLGARMNAFVTVYALEESGADWVDRVIAFQSTSISRTKILNLELTEADFDHWAVDLTPALEETSIFVETAVWSAKEIIDQQVASIEKEMTRNNWTLEEYKKQGIPRVVLVDGFQLLNDHPGESENEKQTRNSRMFMEARGKYNITTIIIAQLNKAGRAYGSETLYKDANFIIQIRRKLGADRQPEAGIAQMSILPNRQSAPFPFEDFLVDGNHSRVSDVGSVELDDDGEIIVNDFGEAEPSPEELNDSGIGDIEENFFNQEQENAF